MRSVSPFNLPPNSFKCGSAARVPSPRSQGRRCGVGDGGPAGSLQPDWVSPPRGEWPKSGWGRSLVHCSCNHLGYAYRREGGGVSRAWGLVSYSFVENDFSLIFLIACKVISTMCTRNFIQKEI